MNLLLEIYNTRAFRLTPYQRLASSLSVSSQRPHKDTNNDRDSKYST